MKKLLLFMSILTFTFSQAQVSLINDNNPGSGDGIAAYESNRIEYNGKLIFAAKVNNSVEILWSTDGTTTQIITSNPFTPTSLYFPSKFYYSTVKNTVFFNGRSNAYGREVYQTDGTLAGTNQFFDLNPGMPESNPQNFTDWDNVIVVAAITSLGTTGEELHYIPNSSPNMVTLEEDIYAGFNDSHPESFIVSNGMLFFSAINFGQREFYFKSQIGQASTVVDINPGNSSESDPQSLITFNNKVYFSADDGTNGRELWVSDGTVAGTQMVLDLNPGATGSNPENLTVFNNALYFTATHSALGTEVFKMTTTQNVTNLKNIASGSSSSSPSDLFTFNGALYFSADDNINGVELWSSTGFSSTTNMVKNINTSNATPDSNPTDFTEYNGKLYFSANDDTNGIELWVTDGTNAGTVIVEDINASGDSNPTDLIVANDLLFFSADDGSTGRELFKYQDPNLLSVNDEELQDITFYPNPTNDSFSIKTNNNNINKVEIYDVQGKTVKTFTENSSSYNIKELTTGLYFVKIKTDKGTTTKKLIKE